MNTLICHMIEKTVKLFLNTLFFALFNFSRTLLYKFLNKILAFINFI